MALDLSKFLIRFVEEAREHVGKLGEGLAALGNGSADGETINAIFRSAHTIKGSSRMLKLSSITDTAHKLEDVLGGLRDGSLSFTPALGSLLYRAVDAIAGLVEQLAEQQNPAALAAADAGLCAELAAAGAVADTDAATGTASTAVVGDQTSAPVPTPVPVVAADNTPLTAAEPVPSPSAAMPADSRLKTAETVRVRLAKLDELIKLMGEVVSSHATSRQRVADIRALEQALGPSLDAEQHSLLRRFAQTLRNDVQAQELLMDELHDKALIMRMLPLAVVFDSAGRMVRELAQSIGKQVDCVVSGAEIELDRQMIDKLSDPVVHLLRNSIDHGIESPAARLAAGKPAHGRVSLSARQDGSWVVVEVSDDGSGVSLAEVRDKAVRKGIISADKAATMSDQEVVDLVFLPGFSTSAIITDISGRGVGMDVVKQTVVDDLQGVVGISTRAGQGTTFSLRLPLSLAVMRVLLVAVDGQPFGFTAQYVAELVRVPAAEMLSVAERNAVIIRNEFVPVVALAELLQIPAALRRPAKLRSHAADGLLLVVVRVRHEKLALVVDELLDERDLVIKPLPDHLRQLALVSGMIITGRNELVSVLHAPALLEVARQARSSSVRREADSQADGPRGYNVLVVDDSLNTREIERDVLEAYGYHVTLAEDGLDGLQKARNGDYDAILTDVEMPNMDGFTLTARLRQEEKYRDTPIVIITSREKEEDKRRGIQVGADAYIVKGDFEQSNLVETLRSLLG